MSSCAHVTLVREYRGDTLDLVHDGFLAIVDEHSKVIFAAGDPETMVFYRSASKPLQMLPVIARGIDGEFGLTQEETVIFAGSHTGESFHIAVLESILRKTGLFEDMLVMKPAVPASAAANEERIRSGLPPRKLYHNCAGKHIALMLVQRKLGAQTNDYWKLDAPVFAQVEETILKMSETSRIALGVDGCGVHVFAVPVRGIANAFKNLASPDMIREETLARAAAMFVPAINRYPLMMRGTGHLCSLLNYDPNIVAKGGANGVYGFGLKKEKLGIAFKFIDGTEYNWALVILEVLRQLGCLSDETRQRLEGLQPYLIYNDNGLAVGRREIGIEVSIQLPAIQSETLIEEYRADVMECEHRGMVCITGESGIVSSVGSYDWTCFYRSASKPIQALPALTFDVGHKYGLTEEEIAIFSGSVWGDSDHIRVFEAILQKTGLREEDMVMRPVYPNRLEQREAMLRANLPPRRIYHNCSGKHMALMLLARELGCGDTDYWHPDSRAQKRVREVVSYMSDTPYERISVGVDGCGVPVFAVPLHAIARSYMKLACPQLIGDAELRGAAEHNLKRLHQYPNMIAGERIVDTIICANPNMIAKSGAMGLYAMGISSLKLGVVFKIMDGSHDEFGLVAAGILSRLGIEPDTVRSIRQHYPDTMNNDNGKLVGDRRTAFTISLRENGLA